MPSELFVVGLSWRSAPVSVREKLAFHDEEIESHLQRLIAHELIDEALILSTCNRVEIYGCTSRSAPASAVAQAAAETRAFISQSRGYPSEKLSGVLFEHLEKDAIRHIFRVASALDSMVVGESQILGQLKSAFGASSSYESLGPVLGRCMERSFGVAKRVRTETGISRGAANISSVAVELAKRVFGELDGKSVLVVGAGKMSALAARHLRADGAAKIRVTNRSPEKAVRLAEEIDGMASGWEDLEIELSKADVIVTSTGAREPVLTKKIMKKTMKRRRYKPCFIMDIAVPRDVETSVGKLEGVYLFDIDDLERLVSENLKERSREAEAATALVEGEVRQFDQWMRQQHVVPTIRSLRSHFHEVAASEVEKAVRAMGKARSEHERQEAMQCLGKGIANKLLHAPMTVLKQAGDAETLADSVSQLFSLESEGEGVEHNPAGTLKPAGIGEAAGPAKKA
ncbi:MAG: glutamyl-tRNA reductase [Myxococcales bacterium]|nr:glutamyl-tRNA reductase [Myxococcales bacterium]